MSPGNGCEEFMTDWSVVCADRKLTAQCWKDGSPQINKLYINISSQGPGCAIYGRIVPGCTSNSFFPLFFFKKNLSFCTLCTLMPHGWPIYCSSIFHVFGKFKAVPSLWHLHHSTGKQVTLYRWVIFFFPTTVSVLWLWVEHRNRDPGPLVKCPPLTLSTFYTE